MAWVKKDRITLYIVLGILFTMPVVILIQMYFQGYRIDLSKLKSKSKTVNLNSWDRNFIRIAESDNKEFYKLEIEDGVLVINLYNFNLSTYASAIETAKKFHRVYTSNTNGSITATCIYERGILMKTITISRSGIEVE